MELAQSERLHERPIEDGRGADSSITHYLLVSLGEGAIPGRSLIVEHESCSLSNRCLPGEDARPHPRGCRMWPATSASRNPAMQPACDLHAPVFNNVWICSSVKARGISAKA